MSYKTYINFTYNLWNNIQNKKQKLKKWGKHKTKHRKTILKSLKT